MRHFLLFSFCTVISCGQTQMEPLGSFNGSSSQELEAETSCQRNFNIFLPTAGYYKFDDDLNADMSFWYDNNYNAVVALRVCAANGECKKYISYINRAIVDDRRVLFQGSNPTPGGLVSDFTFKPDGTVLVECSPALMKIDFCKSGKLGRLTAAHQGGPNDAVCPEFELWDDFQYRGLNLSFHGVQTHCDKAFQKCPGPSGVHLCLPAADACRALISQGPQPDAGAETGYTPGRDGFAGQFMCEQGAIEALCAAKSSESEPCEADLATCSCACVSSSYSGG